MNQVQKQEELEKRLKEFTLRVLKLIKSLPRTEENIIYGRQVIRSSSSIGANYAEATCAHTNADFSHDLNKCRKESKETIYWLELIFGTNPSLQTRMLPLIDEGRQIFKIFMSSVKTAKERQK
ncbi:four helix bundle protein [Candidatus Microgenomates bacterium]|nr:four helix bundle protein [Candidatus Microgenomates bacterium]